MRKRMAPGRSPASILDLGSGTGLLGIAADSLNAVRGKFSIHIDGLSLN